MNSTAKGALLLLGGEFLLALMAAMIKAMADILDPNVLVFSRNLFGLLFLLPIVIQYGPASLRTQHLPLHLVRAGTGLAAMYCYFFVIANLPLAEATLVKLSAPFFIPLVAWLWLREAIGTRTYVAILLGFAGVVLVLRPGASSFEPLALIGVLGALLASVAKVSIRRMAESEPSHRIVFYFGLLATVMSAVPASLNWVTPPPSSWLWLAAIGLAGTLGQLLMTQAYRIANPGRIGPYTYSAVVYAAGLGWLFWGEALALTTILGSLLIIIAGSLNFKRIP